jgi:hypothetical protein
MSLGPTKITLHAGDFLSSDGTYVPDLLSKAGTLRLKSVRHRWLGEKIPTRELVDVEFASEESVARIGAAVGWSAAGALLLGPIGLLAGALELGRKKRLVTFVARFRDGRTLLATTDNVTFGRLQAVARNP